MRLTKRQLVKLIREAAHEDSDFAEETYDSRYGDQDRLAGFADGVDRYDLYTGPDGDAASAALDDLMEEVSNFMNAAREKLDALMKKHEKDDSGLADYEAQDAVKHEFGRAVLGKFER
jgi:hypothetical protein